MKMPLVVGVCATMMTGAAGARAADVAVGEAYYKKNCANCHGKTAKGMASFPSLRDRDAGYLADRLETYRARGKVGPNSALMYAHAGKLEDDEILHIAAYLEAAFGTPKIQETPQGQEAAPDGVERDNADARPVNENAGGRSNPGTPGIVACAQEKGEIPGECRYRVTQGRDDEAAVTVTFGNGFKRTLFFKGDAFLKANATMSGAGTDTDWVLEDGLHRIRVDDQRYDIPGALLSASEAEAGATKVETAAPDPQASAPVDLAKGKKHFRKNCRACHGPKAQGMASYPGLAGQPAEYLVMRLEQYRAGERLGPNTPLMAPRARKLSDQDIADIVAYIGTFD